MKAIKCLTSSSGNGRVKNYPLRKFVNNLNIGGLKSLIPRDDVGMGWEKSIRTHYEG